MSKYNVQAVSTASPKRVYDLLLDGRTWPRWSAIDSFESEGPSSNGSIGDVRVFTTGKNATRERITHTEENRSVSYEILTGSRLLLEYQGRIDLHPTPHGGTRIEWHATWRAPFPGAGLLMERFLRRFQQHMVNGLAQFAQQGTV
jgi:uncharacterized protein YndB with AHSA1/START domain